MLRCLKQDTFIKDLLLLLLVSIIFAALFAAGFAMATDKYFARAVSGVIGDFGQYDILFQNREELKGAITRQIEQIITERFPGATLKQGVTLAGKTTFFLTLPDQYKTKAVYESFSYIFKNLPGNGGYSIMTEPRINITSVPGGSFDFLAKQVEAIPGVRFTFHDGNSIGVIMKNNRVQPQVIERIKGILERYQILEVRLTSSGHASEELITLGKQASQAIVGIKGVDYVKDVTMSGGSDDYQYLVNTLSEVKRFMLAYAAEVQVKLDPGQELAVGDLLAINGQNKIDIRPGGLLEPLQVVVKVTAVDASGIHGLIIQGDSGFLRDKQAYRLLSGDKIGAPLGSIEVSSRKSQLIYAMDQGVKLLTQINQALNDYNSSTGGAGLTVDGIEKVYGQLAQIKNSLVTMDNGIDSLSGKAQRGKLGQMVTLVNSVGDDLDYLARTFGRVQLLSNRFNGAMEGLRSTRILMGSPLLQGTIGQTGGIADKMQLLNTQLNTVENSLQARITKLDDFINRFNPLVATLLSWRNKANDFARLANNFGTVFTPGSANQQKLKELISATNQVVSGITVFDLPQVKKGLGFASDRLFGSDRVNLSAIIAQLVRTRDSLPRLLDEEIGHSVNLIDKYVGGETVSGERIQLFTKANIDRTLVDAAIRDILKENQAGIFSLPVGTIQPDIRGELFGILAEVRSVIAALLVFILWVLSFILDQSLMISMLKIMGYSWLPKRDFNNRWLNLGYRLATRVVSPANLYAVGIGAIWLGLTFSLSGARIPYLNSWQIAIGGGLLGILIASMAERINPINKDEVLAGLSLGMSFKSIMREIVVPGGRPGMMQLLNRWKMVMK